MKKIYLTTLCLLTISMLKAQFTVFNTSNSNIPSNVVSGGVAVDKNNNIWIGTQGAGVAKFDGTSWTVYNAAVNGLPSDYIACIAVDTNNNNIWIGTVGDGVAKFNGSTWTTYNYASGLCDNGIYAIAIDKNDSIWFGSWGAGVSELSGTKWTTFATQLPNDQGAIASIYYITVDASNNKWFGTSLGLVKYNGTSFTTIDQTTTPDLKSTYINTIAIDASNNRWLGVGSNGLAKLNSSSVWVENDTTGLCDKTVRDIKINSNGDIWTGEHTIYGSKIVGGITKFNPATSIGTSYASTFASTGVYSDQVFNIAIDNNNIIWVATGNNGLLKFTESSGINENYSNNYLDIYPNPAYESLNIKSNINSGIIEISDATGRVVLIQDISASSKINIENLVNGVYFIKVTENNIIFNAKFIKD